MRLALALALIPLVAGADPQAARRARLRAEWLHAPWVEPGGDARGKPDDHDAFDLLSVTAELMADPGRLPGFARYTVTLRALQEDVSRVALLAAHYTPFLVTDDRDADLRFDHDPGSALLAVDLIEPVDTGDEVVLRIDAEVSPDCRSATECVDDAPQRHRAHIGWFPSSFAFPLTDRFLFDLRFLVDPREVVAGTGTPARIEPAMGQASFRYVAERPTALPGFAMGELVVGAPAGFLPIVTYAPPGSGDGGQTMGALAARIVAFYDGALAPYPFSRLGIAAIDDSAGAGLGMQALVLIPAHIWDVGPGDPDLPVVGELLAHEIAHQYFFNLVGVAGPGNAWLSESFAEFSATRWSEVDSGGDSHARLNAWSYLLSVPAAEDEALASPTVSVNPRSFEILYAKGSFVVGMLRRQLGPEVFDEVLRRFLEAFADQLATTDELQRFFETETGEPLGEFFGQWVRRPGYPILTVRAEAPRRVDDPVRLTVTQGEPPRGGFTGPLPLRVHTTEGGADDYQVSIGVAEHTIAAGPAMWVEVDPDFTFLRRVQADPIADVNLSGVVDGMDLLDVHAALGRATPDANWDERFDVNRDQVVDDRDLQAVRAAIGDGW